MKKTVITAALALSLLTSLGLAGTIKIPKEKPAVAVKVPDSWEPEETDEGIAIESPDKVATVFLEVAASEKGLNALIEENVDWLVKEQNVKINAASKQEKDVEIGGRKWSRISWDGTSKEWGAATVGFLMTETSKGKVLTVTYWITKKGAEKHLDTLESILSSVKPIGE